MRKSADELMQEIIKCVIAVTMTLCPWHLLFRYVSYDMQPNAIMLNEEGTIWQAPPAISDKYSGKFSGTFARLSKAFWHLEVSLVRDSKKLDRN